MIRLITASVLTLSLPFDVIADEALLTIGSRAPAFKAGGFVQGPAFTELSPATVYVIEFSGTECAPCIKMIPEMEKLQREHEQVVFVSVFSEPADRVREFLEGPGKDMTLRVACDAEGTLWQAWTQAPAQAGIPHVFVVDGSGRIGWIGYPWNLADPLARIVVGESADPVERMRLQIAQHATLRKWRTERREEVANDFNNEWITSLIQRGKLEEAIQALDEGITTYRELPQYVKVFRARKLFLLGRVPGRRDEAFSLARDIAVDATLNGEPIDTGAPNYLLNHYENADPENRDERMAYLALALLTDSEAPDGGSTKSLGERNRYFTTLARAYYLLGDRERAVTALDEGIASTEGQIRELRSNDGEQWYIEEVERGLDRLRKRRAAYKAD